MFLTAGRRAAIVWRQAGDPYIPATLAPRDHHRRLVSRGRHAMATAVSAGGGGGTVTGALGTATASGLSGTVDANRTVAGALGTAAASGFQGTVNNTNDTTVSGGLGTADATGLAATVNANRTIAGAQGVAVASGLSGTVSNANDVAVNGSLGTAVATGFAATLTVNTVIAGNIGVALATGYQGGVSDGSLAPVGGGGWLPSMRRKTRKQIHEERVRLGILKPDIVRAAKRAAQVVADDPAPIAAYKRTPQQVNEVFMQSLGVSKMLPDYTRAIEAQIKVIQQEEEDLMLFM